MSPAMIRTIEDEQQNSEDEHSRCLKGVKLLHDVGVTQIPRKYILPFPLRPDNAPTAAPKKRASANLINLPIIDLADLQGPNRSDAINSLSSACESFGFFQVVNHGIPEKIITNVMDAAGRFFDLPYEVRRRYMSSDMRAPVRYGTSFNQNKDGVFCWRDFLKLVCDPSSTDQLPLWPDSPADFRDWAYSYSKEAKNLSIKLTDAILESLGLRDSGIDDVGEMLEEFENGSQLMVVNCYPPCPQPELTLGMPPHSDYGFITLLLQDEVCGLQIQHRGDWVTVDPIPNSFVVNIGDHLEIFSNGLYKSVLHRVLTNSKRLRSSVASLHTFPFDKTITPCDTLVRRIGKKLYKGTNFADFLEYASTREPKGKDFLESRKL